MVMDKDILSKLPKKMPGGRGRPGIDWDALYDEFLKSNKSKVNFLHSKGINPTLQNVKQKTAMWVNNSKDALEHIRQTDKWKKENGTTDEGVIVANRVAEVMEIVNGWRISQAMSDYKTADNIRMHLKIILQKSLKREMVDGKESFDTLLRPSDLRHLSDVLATLQKVQRLALGMSTENVGVERLEDLNKPDDMSEDDIPIFVVEVGSNGKFERPRPRLIKK